MTFSDFLKYINNSKYKNNVEYEEDSDENEYDSTPEFKSRFYISPKNKTLSKKKLDKIQMDISSLLEEKKNLTDTINLINESIKETNRQRLLKEVIELEKNKDKLLKTKKRLSDDVNQLSFKKEMLKVEIENLKDERNEITDIPISMEYIDSLATGLDFEKCFSLILKKLNYTDIQITSGSGDFGIDVLAKKDDILYGFQCKLYNGTVGNDAVQQAFSGKTHYNCNVAIVVTNNFFTDQAKEQAMETQVILWDRKVLSKKIKEINN